MRRNFFAIAAIVLMSFVTSCNNSGDATGVTDTSFNVGTNPSTGNSDTGINGTNGNVPNTPDTTNNYQSPTTTQHDTLNRQ